MLANKDLTKYIQQKYYPSRDRTQDFLMVTLIPLSMLREEVDLVCNRHEITSFQQVDTDRKKLDCH